MNEELDLLLEMTKDSMLKAVKHLDNELAKLRAGKANPAMLDGLTVDYYGVNTPLNQASNINSPDARTITIQPWDKSMIHPIEKVIMAANLGFNPVNNGELIRIVVPPLSEERRKDLIRKSRSEGETAKIAIRNVRRDTNEELKKLKKDGLPEDMEKDAEIEVQQLTDDFIKQIDKILEKKEQDILTI